MKTTTKDKEIEKLKKQVEKLKSERDSLIRDKRSLRGKLATAQAKADKYHDALKKKATYSTIRFFHGQQSSGHDSTLKKEKMKEIRGRDR